MAGEQDRLGRAVGAVVAEHFGEDRAGDAAAAVLGDHVHVGDPGGVADGDAPGPADGYFAVEGGVLPQRRVGLEVLRHRLAVAGRHREAVGEVLAPDALDGERLGNFGDAAEAVDHERLGGAEAVAEGFVGVAHGGVGLVGDEDRGDAEVAAGFFTGGGVHLGGRDAAGDPFLAAAVGGALARGVAHDPKPADAVDVAGVGEAAGVGEGADEGFDGAGESQGHWIERLGNLRAATDDPMPRAEPTRPVPFLTPRPSLSELSR